MSGTGQLARENSEKVYDYICSIASSAGEVRRMLSLVIFLLRQFGYCYVDAQGEHRASADLFREFMYRHQVKL